METKNDIRPRILRIGDFKITNDGFTEREATEMILGEENFRRLVLDTMSADGIFNISSLTSMDRVEMGLGDFGVEGSVTEIYYNPEENDEDKTPVALTPEDYVRLGRPKTIAETDENEYEKLD